MSESPQRLITYFSDKAKAPRWVWAPNPQWSPRKRERLPADKEMTPGPIYSPRHQGQRTAWQFGTSNREWDHLPRDFWPQLAPGAAPDQYSIKAPKQRPLSFARGPNRVDFEIPDTPGPGHRSTDIAVERPRHPAYSMGSKPQFLWSTYAPGRPARGQPSQSPQARGRATMSSGAASSVRHPHGGPAPA
ncbi:unnamed protein product [Effrenium voratum]|uniref:Uncharacterized protein n=1 Tax=Effrenium voratum TaxID=2562239 RepID=A0AA36IW31_9DINO|nr:unnamed protein product [Effrenium voratum]CAJ1393960.1 unnamed protein product [Effrenium voratum]